MSQTLLSQHAHGMGPSSIFGCQPLFQLSPGLKDKPYQVTNLLAVSDAFSEKLTFFQKFSTSLKYRIKNQMLKNHDGGNPHFFWQSHPEIATRKKMTFSYFLPPYLLIYFFLVQLAGKVEIFFQKKVWYFFCFVMKKKAYLEKFSSYSLGFTICEEFRRCG